MDERVLLHIGASKCGSSALQSALSRRPVLSDRKGNRIAYVALRRNQLVWGSELAEASRERPSQALSCGPASQMILLEGGDQRRLRRQIGRLLNTHHRLILSCEGWLKIAAKFKRSGILPKLGITAHAIVYVRPQVPFMNASWWQWGAWTGMTLDEWIEKRLRSSCWASRVDRWGAVPGVANVTIRLLPADIVSDFLDLLSCDPSPFERKAVNSGLPASILRLYQRHPRLRTSRNAGMDFLLSRKLSLPGNPPWVIDKERAERIVAATRDDNLALRAMLDPASAEAMDADRRWWDADAFLDRVPVPAEPPPPVGEEMEQLSIALIDAFVRPIKEKRARQRNKGPAYGRVVRMLQRKLSAKPTPKKALKQSR